MRRLFATTRPLDEPADLLASSGPDGLLWSIDHGGLAGLGCAAVLDLPRGLDDAAAVRTVGEQLAAIETDDPLRRPGTGVVALGALPFDRAQAASLTVPALVVGRDAEGSWVTSIGPDRAVPRLPEPAAPGPPPPDGFTLTPSLSHAAWQELVAEAVEHIQAGDLAKVVLARSIRIDANRAFVTSDAVERLMALYPACMVFRIGAFLGASPELLIARRGAEVRSHPLAGTVARSGDAAADRALVAGLLGSTKERAEHDFVVTELRDALAAHCTDIEVPERPSILELRNVSHLATAIRGTLRRDPAGSLPSALDLVAAVHPTPAVAGTPTDKATAYLQTAEGFDRGLYAGPVGWVDGRGDGEWAIGIRSAVVEGNRARICAGVGVVADSEPRAELAETQLKLQALLAALVRP